MIAVLLAATIGLLVWRGELAEAKFGARAIEAGAPSDHPSGPTPERLGVNGASAFAGGDAMAGLAMAAWNRLIRLGLPVYCGGSQGPYVALTFDDGPGPYTARTLRILRAAGDTATFFDVGKELRYWRGVPWQEAQIGVVGDHTWSHLRLTGLSFTQQRTQIMRAREALIRATGAPVELFRPPEEAHSRASDKLVSSAGMLEVMWSTDSQDSAPGATPESVLEKAQAGLRPGAIILFHENRGSTLADLPALLQLIRDMGLRTVTVPELLGLDPLTEAQVRQDARAGACAAGS